MDESKQFHECGFRMSERDLYGKAIFCNSPAGHKDQHAHVFQEFTVSPFVTTFQPPKDWHAGAEEQRQVGPCGKHPVACIHEHVDSCYGKVPDTEGSGGYLRCGFVQGCRWCASEQALRAELTTLRDKLREMEARVTFLNSWLTKLKESSDDMTKDIAALLAEEAGR